MTRNKLNAPVEDQLENRKMLAIDIDPSPLWSSAYGDTYADWTDDEILRARKASTVVENVLNDHFDTGNKDFVIFLGGYRREIDTGSDYNSIGTAAVVEDFDTNELTLRQSTRRLMDRAVSEMGASQFGSWNVTNENGSGWWFRASQGEDIEDFTNQLTYTTGSSTSLDTADEIADIYPGEVA